MNNIWLAQTLVRPSRLALLAVAVILTLPPARAGEQKSGSATKTAAPAPVPQSVFEIPHNQSEGRDPFFPPSTRVYLEAGPKTTPVAVTTTVELKLNGLTGPPRRSCMINGETFLVGDEASVKDLKNPGVKMAIRCIDIKDNSVTIQIISTGQQRELRLAPGAAP